MQPASPIICSTIWPIPVRSASTTVPTPRWPTLQSQANWGICGFNQTHNFIVTYIYNLPAFRNNTSLVGKILGGWEVSGDVALINGFNTTLSVSSDYLGNGSQSIGATLPAYAKANCSYRGSRTVTQFYNTSCFCAPPLWPNTGLVGSAAYNQNPGVDNADFALIKNGPIWAEHNLRYHFRAEFFNFFNHPSFKWHRYNRDGQQLRSGQ